MVYRVVQLNALQNSYNLFGMVTFPTGIGKDYISVIVNIFIYSPKFDNYRTFPLNNGLLNHDA
jgi:ERCC4-related helicase